MAKYYELTFATGHTDLEAALIDYYGDGVTIHSRSSSGVVFSCPQISDKYIRVYIRQPTSNCELAVVNLYVSTALNSDGTLSSPITVCSSGPAYTSGTRYGIHLVVSNAFLLLQCGHSNNALVSSIIIAKCTNGRYLFISGGGSKEIAGLCMYSDELVASPIRFVALSSFARFKSSGKLILLPSFFANDTEMELNSDGSFAHIDGLFCSDRYIVNTPIVGANYYIAIALIRGNDASGIYVNSSLYVELEP